MGDDFRKLDLGDRPENPDSKPPSGWDYLSHGGFVRCAFSTPKTVEKSSKINLQKHENLVYWYIEQVGEELFEASRINKKYIPAGNPEPIPLHQLVNEFTPQLAYYEKMVLPALEELNDILNQGDEYREDGRLYSAEMEYERACTIEEQNVRALFGLGLIYLTRKEVQRTRELLTELVRIKAVFTGKNQHLFNEFGIALRKNQLFAEAVVYYRRALDFVTTDENLFYNLARAHYEKGEWNECLEALIQSHRLNPGLEIARDLFEVIVGLAEDDKLLKRYDKPPIPPKVLTRVRQIMAVETGRLPLDEGPVIFGTEQGRARTGGIINLDDPDDH